MLNHQTKLYPVDSITIEPNRQRKELRGIEELAESISRNGLINPIVITPEGVLVAGERRLTATRSLGHTHILVRLTETLDEGELQVLEYEENAKRLDLTWRESIAAVTKYHNLMVAMHGDWSAPRSAEALSMSLMQVSRCLKAQSYIDEGDELVCGAETLQAALNIIARKEQRQENEAKQSMDSLMDAIASGEDPVAALSSSSPASPASTSATVATPGTAPSPMSGEAAFTGPKGHPFIHADFNLWVAEPWRGPKFNFIHCDFPYGINYDKHGKGAADKFGGYEDTAEVYYALLDSLEIAMQTHVADNAHMMFWLSPKYLARTKGELGSMGWKVQDYPLIWHRSDNAGIIPDTKRSPRQVYEMCLMCTRGDRFVAQSVSNLFAHPKTKEIHASEKPKEMLRHFFRMFVDETTVMLDPTMGSGGAVAVAEEMGAKFALGLERDQTFFENAVVHYKAQASK